MHRAYAIRGAFSLVFAVLLPVGPAYSQTCEPSPDGFGCTDGPCGAIPEDKCLATVFQLDIATGAIKTEACACQDFNLCHVEPGNASFFAVGACPSGEHCELISFDLDGDGITERFTATCLPDTKGVCCIDIDDGPVAYDTCASADPDSCSNRGGIFHGIGPRCEETQGCCFTFAGSDACAQLNPSCCLDSGGVPQGLGSTCDAASVGASCPQVCGGFAGIQCNDPNAFCQLPPGGCCCDMTGVCVLPPTGCPDVWDPVCGCDGRTYGNACEAAAAGASISHPGACEPGACCLPNAAGALSCTVLTRSDCNTRGGNFQGVGTTCPLDPAVPCGLPTGSCCVLTSPTGPQFCFDGTADECSDAGGTFGGTGTSCNDPNIVPCGFPQAACCFNNGACANLTTDVCLADGGVPAPTGTTCDVVFCQGPVIGACCVQPPDGTTPFCTQTTVVDCLGQGGSYLGDGSSCPFNGAAPCDFLIGACCTIFPTTGTEGCFEGSESDCASAGGEFLGGGTKCPLDPGLPCSTIPGACCLPDGTCLDVPFERCVSLGGEAGPLGSNCAGHFCTPPPTGACCHPDANGNLSCDVTTQRKCSDIGGVYQGDATPCVVAGVSTCPVAIGACCTIFPATGTEQCFEGSRLECANSGGEFLGEGSHCPDDPNQGCTTISSACCFADGGCADVPFEVCVANNGRPGPLGSQCALVDCAIIPTGACCLANSVGSVSCEETTQNRCEERGGAYRGDNTSCPSDATTPCEVPTGACCRRIAGAPESFCENTSEATCTGSGGEYLGDGTTCPPDGTNLCPAPTGACCVFDPAGNTADCFVASREACANEFGSYLGDGTQCPADADLPCANPRGACCFVSPGAIAPSCLEITLEICDALGGRYLGDGSSCPDDPTLACPSVCPALCGVHECVSGCGTIVQGAECLLFETAWGTFVLSDFGPFGVGDRVRIKGCLDPFCATICQQGDGCIQNFAIEPCGEVCGGIAGVPCSSPNDYCQFRVGTCGDSDMQGICVPIPGNGCPENYDPVCGCDGVTYGNECEAAAAAVSIAHRGACDVGECATVRRLGDPEPTYCPGQRKTIHISINVPPGTTAIAVEDVPPAGWEVVAISDHGTFDATNGKVKWGPMFAPFPQGLNYVVIPTASDQGPACFSGTISIEGINRETCGELCLDQFCRPFHPVDLPQPPCDSCPLSDCNGCNHGSCQDGRISLCEVISYACSWKTGCNDNLSDLTRAAFVWITGECYCWSETRQNWFPSPCASSSSGLCSDVGSRGGALEPTAIGDRPGAVARIRFTTAQDGRRGATHLARITIRMNPPEATEASALEFRIPTGWSVMETGGGKWDDANRKVKWGPYMEGSARTVFVTARKQLRKIRGLKRDATRNTALRGFEGRVSFDGINQPVIVRRSTERE